MINNPILRGFCPDPSIIRANKDYYIATSTFEWLPGIRLFHSKDLQHWEQMGSPITRTSQADLKGDPDSGGLWAPCLSYDGTFYYLVYTDVKTKKGRFYNTHNYVIRTRSLDEEWSDPVYLNSVGFDPSLFHDSDGRKYLLNMINGFKGVLLQQYNADTGELIGDEKLIYKGSGLGCTEGPHLYHIKKYYYLIVAEGGTGYDHCVTMARSENIWGPYETDPYNPVLTSDINDSKRIQKCGHADIVNTGDDEWYMVHLCSRPDSDNECILGRETAIQKMIWKNGWLRTANGDRLARNETPEPQMVTAYNAMTIPDLDDFNETRLWNCYVAPRIYPASFTDLSIRKGWIRIYGHESANSWHNVSLIARRQTEKIAEASTHMEFNPSCPEQAAGLMYVYDSHNYYLICKTSDDDGQQVVSLLKSDMGDITDCIKPVFTYEPELEFRIAVGENEQVTFYYREKNTDWILLDNEDAKLLSDEHCRGFTGAQFGLYAHDMTGYRNYADFDWFNVTCGE